jgi:hypothetical protein
LPSQEPQMALGGRLHHHSVGRAAPELNPARE